MAWARLQELEGLAQELLRALGSGWAEELLRQGLERRRDLELRLLDTRGRAGGVLQALVAAEAAVAERVLCREAELRRCRQRLQGLLSQVQRAQEAWAGSQARSQHLIHLYYKISRIDWDYEAEPGRVRGVHYGPDIAQPFDLDTARHSRLFISDFLWSLVPTEWGPQGPPPRHQDHQNPPLGAPNAPPGGTEHPSGGSDPKH